MTKTPNKAQLREMFLKWFDSKWTEYGKTHNLVSLPTPSKIADWWLSKFPTSEGCCEKKDAVMENKTCCEMCRGSIASQYKNEDIKVTHYCKEPNCPCHQKAGEKEVCVRCGEEKEIVKGEKYHVCPKDEIIFPHSDFITKIKEK